MVEQRDLPAGLQQPSEGGVGRSHPSPPPRVRPPGADDYGEQDENGVDLSLLRYTLSLSPLDRLQLMERCARDTQLLNEYGRRARETASGQNR